MARILSAGLTKTHSFRLSGVSSIYGFLPWKKALLFLSGRKMGVFTLFRSRYYPFIQRYFLQKKLDTNLFPSISWSLIFS